MERGLGTQLRHLLDLLDGAVEAAYAKAGIAYRPRYTPVMRALTKESPCGIGRIASLAGISQPAATQTVALMLKAGLLESVPHSTDARQRLVQFSAKGRAILPELQVCWQATREAANGLDADLPVPLSGLLEQAIAALERRSFDDRIAQARRRLATGKATSTSRRKASS